MARQTRINNDQGGDLARLDKGQQANDAQITALIGAANADRKEFREQSEADRQAFKEALESDRAEWREAMAAEKAEQLEAAATDKTEWREAMAAEKAEWREAMANAQTKADADRAKWQEGFNAQQEILQRLLLEIRSTNGEVQKLGDRVTDLEDS